MVEVLCFELFLAVNDIHSIFFVTFDLIKLQMSGRRVILAANDFIVYVVTFDFSIPKASK